MSGEKSKLMPTIFVEGNVGVGKTTFLEILEQYLQVKVIPEPVKLWQNIDNHNLLEQFFLNGQRWAYTLQSYILTTQIDQLNNADACQVRVVERSVYSGRYCFAKVAHEIGTMDDLEWALYKKLWNREAVNLDPKLFGFIYLRASPSVCYDRIKNRNRREERFISLSYLQDLEKKQEDWLMHRSDIDDELSKIPVLVLDASFDLRTDNVLRQHYAQEVQQFINTITTSRL